MDSKKIELEKRLSALDGFTELEESEYRYILSTIFDDVKINISIVKEFLRYYYKNTKVTYYKKSEVCSFDGDNKKFHGIKELEYTNYEKNPKVKDIINIAIDKVARKIYKLFIEKLDYFLVNGKIKLTKYEDYLHDPDDYKLEPERNKDADYDKLWDEYENISSDYYYEGYGYYTEHNLYKKSGFPIWINNAEYKDFNEKDNTVFVEKCKLYSNSLAKFKNIFIKDLKNNLLQFKYNYEFQLIFKDIIRHDMFSYSDFLSIPEAYDKLKNGINDEYNSFCGLNFAVPYLTEINRDVIEKRKKIQAEIDALN